MRDINRINKFCNELEDIWKKSFPDLRYGQLMINFLSWIQSNKKIDPFFPEEDKMIELLREYANTISICIKNN